MLTPRRSAGRKGTAYPGFDRSLSSRSDERVVVDGNCVTSKGPGSTFEFALKVLCLSAVFCACAFLYVVQDVW